MYPKGSTGKLTQILHEGLKKRNFESAVLYGRGKKIDAPYIHYVCGDIRGKLNHALSRVTGLMYGGCYASTQKIKKIIRKQQPDVVHLQCINGYFVNIYNLVDWLKKSGIAVVVTLHAEFMYTANCSYSYDCDGWLEGCTNCKRCRQETESIFFNNTAKSFEKMRKSFEGFNDSLAIVSVSPWLLERAKRSVILKDKRHLCIYNGVDTEVFCRYEDDSLKKELCPNGEKMIFHATAYFSDDVDDRKGGVWLLRLAQQMKDENVRFVVAGDYSVKQPLPDNVVLLGKIADQHKLAKLYSAADVTLMLSKKETFSMVVAESLCCGTPIVGFEAGAPEQISIPQYSDFYQQGDLDGVRSGVEKWLFDCGVSKEDIARKAKEVYSTEKMVEDYIELYRSFK